VFFRYVSHIGKDNRESDGKDAANADHSKEPPRVDGHKGDGSTRDQHGDEQEELAAPDVRQRANQGGRQERQESLDPHYNPVHEKRMIWKRLIEYLWKRFMKRKIIDKE